MENVLSFKEYMQREIPILNRQFAFNHPITALTNLIIPLLKQQGRYDVLKQLDKKIKEMENKVNRKITVIEKWMLSPKGFMKVVVINKWGKPVSKKLYKREIEEDVHELTSWIYSEIVYKLLYKKGLDIPRG